VSKKRATTEAAFSDLKMIQAIAKTMTREHQLPERKGPVTLNTDNRKNEIYRIMKENHKLLEHIENVEPWIKSADLVKDHRMKQRYVINASHTMRLSGDYDPLIAHFRRLDQTQVEETKHRIQARLMRSSGGSVSLPSLTPNGGRGQGNESSDGRGEASLPSLTPPARPQESASPAKGNARTAPAAVKGSSSASSSSGGKGGKAGGRGQGAAQSGKAAEEAVSKGSEAADRSLQESELHAAELVLAAPPAEAGDELAADAADEPAEAAADAEAAPEALPQDAAEAEEPIAADEEAEEPFEADQEAQEQAEEPFEADQEAADMFEVDQAPDAQQEAVEEAQAEESASPADVPAKQEEAADSAEVQESIEAPGATATEQPGDEYEDEYEEDFANESMSASMKKKETIEPFEDSANFEEDTSS